VSVGYMRRSEKERDEQREDTQVFHAV
jgi:hypothetical protein